MRVLVACEFSGVVRRAFRALGHDAWSCDLLPAEDGSPFHIQADVIQNLGYDRAINKDTYQSPWDLMIAHPPCTFMANSGAKHLYVGMRKENGPNPERWAELRRAAAFFQMIIDAPIPRIAVENPIMIGHAQELISMRPAQIIQPWQYGHGETKATCLWLKNLPPLVPTDIVAGRDQRVFRMPPSADRWKERSRTFTGIADAMALQWGALDQQRVAA